MYVRDQAWHYSVPSFSSPPKPRNLSHDNEFAQFTLPSFYLFRLVPTLRCMCRCFATIQLYISPMTEHNCWLHSSRPCNARKPPSIPRLTQECSDPAAVCAAAQKGSNCSQHRKTSPRNNNHSGRSVSRKVHGELFKTSDDQIVREKTNATRDEQFRLFLSKFPHQITYI